ncbi:flavin reductase family protein [Trebonia sp.]|uniref:flavin reductase family protein n=1 Tax=Trebonia sp. TaxID=2767075 RepID=UPI00260B33DE|nr:flavin reductase family protein [Trebonia sp.]
MRVDSREFRQCLGQFATGVTVVTCRTEAGLHGATVNAFTAVSLDPPLVLVALDRRAKVCGYITGRPFAVTVLDSDAHQMALHFAGQQGHGAAVGWVDHEVAPRIAGGLAWFACTPWASYDGGDHVLHVGLVQDCQRHPDGPDSRPLVFHGGEFRSVGEHLAGAPWLDTLDSPECDIGWVLPRLTGSTAR